MNELIILVCIFLGIATRTALPALRKMREDPNFSWSHQYTATAAISFIVSALSALTLYQSFAVPQGTDIQVCIAAYLAGLGINSGVDELSEWIIKNE